MAVGSTKPPGRLRGEPSRDVGSFVRLAPHAGQFESAAPSPPPWPVSLFPGISLLQLGQCMGGMNQKVGFSVDLPGFAAIQHRPGCWGFCRIHFLCIAGNVLGNFRMYPGWSRCEQFIVRSGGLFGSKG